MFAPVIIVIHILSVILLLVIGTYGAYLTRPVLPLPEALGNWKEGQVAWVAFWVISFYQVVIPLTTGLWWRTEIGAFVVTKELAVVFWAFIFALIAGVIIGVRTKRTFGFFGIVGFGVGFAVAFLFYLVVDGFIWGMLMKYNPAIITSTGTLADLTNFSDYLSVINAVFLVLYWIVPYLSSRKMLISLAKKRRMIK